MEHLIKLDIEKHSENGETYYVATSPDIQGLVAEGVTVSESIAIAKDIAEIILADQFDRMRLRHEAHRSSKPTQPMRLLSSAHLTD